jgi:hypothetical protein
VKLTLFAFLQLVQHWAQHHTIHPPPLRFSTCFASTTKSPFVSSGLELFGLWDPSQRLESPQTPFGDAPNQFKWCFFLIKASMTFSCMSKERKKTDGFTGQSLDARSERQVALMGWPTSRLAFQQIIGT